MLSISSSFPKKGVAALSCFHQHIFRRPPVTPPARPPPIPFIPLSAFRRVRVNCTNVFLLLCVLGRARSLSSSSILHVRHTRLPSVKNGLFIISPTRIRAHWQTGTSSRVLSHTHTHKSTQSTLSAGEYKMRGVNKIRMINMYDSANFLSSHCTDISFFFFVRAAAVTATRHRKHCFR